MKKLVLLLLLAVPAIAGSADLGMEILAPATAPWNSSVDVILRTTSYGPFEDPADTVQINFRVDSSFVEVTAPGWSCGTGSGTFTSGVCNHTGLSTGQLPDIQLRFSSGGRGTVTRVGANVRTTNATDPGPHPNEAEVFVQAVPPSTVEVVVSAAPDPAYARDVVTYTYTIENHGPQPANNVRLQISNCCGEPSPTFLGIAAEGGWTCGEYNPGAYLVSCTIPTLPVGPAPSIAMTVQMPFEGGTYGSGVGVFGDLTEGEVTAAFLQVLSKADLSLEITGPTTAAPDSVVQHSVNVSNGGPGTAASLSVSISGTSIAGVEGDGWSCADDICTRPALAAQTTAPPIVVTSQTPGSGMMLLSATVSSATADLEPSNDTHSVSVDVDAAMSIASIAPASGSVAGGTTVTITGHGFTPQSVAAFDNVRVTTVFVSDTTLRATTRAHAPGAVDVAVVNPDDTVATLTKAFTYEPPGRSKRRSARH